MTVANEEEALIGPLSSDEVLIVPRYALTRYKIVFLTVFIFSAMYLFLVDRVYMVTPLFNIEEPTMYQTARPTNLFTIDTEGCSIPGMIPFFEEVKPLVEYPFAIKPCPRSNTKLLSRNRTHIWLNEDNLKHYNLTNKYKVTCCYLPFFRSDVTNVWSTWIDDRYEFKACVNFTQTIEARDEYVKVYCTNEDNAIIYDSYFLFAIKKKMMEWNRVGEIAKNKSAYNVVILGIDNVSRLNFHRTMPKTLEYILKKGAVELLGYNKVGYNSYPNLVPFLMGYNSSEINTICYPHRKSTFDMCPFVWNLYKLAGYFTAFAEDTAGLGTFNYLADGFIRKPVDYYGHPFLVIAEKFRNTSDLSAKLCTKEKRFYEVLLDYVEDIMTTLRSSKFFGFFWEVSMTHDYLSFPMLMDEYYLQFFKRIDKMKYLDDTIILLVSDHGSRWGEIRSTKQGRLEESLPFVYIMTPPSFRNNYSEAFNNLRENRKRLTTPFDINALLKDLTDLNSIKNENIRLRSNQMYAQDRAISLFLPVPTNRTCEMARIGEAWCTCHQIIAISSSSAEVQAGAKYMINYINSILEDSPVCAKLVLNKVVDAQERVAGKTDKNEITWREFVIKASATPGEGIFEATLRLKGENWSAINLPSRLNLYGDQSRCVHQPHLRLYCYCK